MIRKALRGNVGLLVYCAISAWTCWTLRETLHDLEDMEWHRKQVAKMDPVARAIPEGSTLLETDGKVTVANVGATWN